jgi:hypothetical protein
VAAVNRGGQFVVVLCEDETQFNFVRHFLLLKGIVRTSAQITPVVCPRGCGEQFVRQNFPKELHGCRIQNRTGRFTLLIVAIDADVYTARHREQHLRDICATDALTRNIGYIQPNEPVAVFIPRRNIETWVRLLGNNVVDETTDYKHGVGATSCKQQVSVLFNHCQQQTLPPHAVASLIAACDEYHKILPMLPQS